MIFCRWSKISRDAVLHLFFLSICVGDGCFIVCLSYIYPIFILYLSYIYCIFIVCCRLGIRSREQGRIVRTVWNAALVREGLSLWLIGLGFMGIGGFVFL